MAATSAGSDPREIATFVLPGAVGIGLGVAAGMLLSASPVVWGVLAVVGAIAGHAVGAWFVVSDR